MSEQQPTAFFSYARWDDQHDDGYLSQFRKHLADEVQAQTGNEFLIFQDQVDVVWGQDWQQRITESLNEAVLYIPILTPTFFKRPACREEATLFLERDKAQGQLGLILPVWYISLDESQRATDTLAQALEAYEYRDWRHLRRKPFDQAQVQVALENLVTQLREALQRSKTPGLTKVPSPVKPLFPKSSMVQVAATVLPQTVIATPAQIVTAVSDLATSPDLEKVDPVVAAQPPQLEALPSALAAEPIPGRVDSLINMGIALGQMGDMKGAVVRFQQAIALDPGNADTVINIGRALLQMGDVSGALNHFSQAVAVAPNSADAHNGIGTVLGLMGNLIGAAEQFREAITVEPSFGMGYINLGMSLGQMGDMNGAYQQFRQAASLPPKDPDALISIGVALGQMGDMNGAMEHFRQAIAVDPSSAENHTNVGLTLWQVGDLNDAAAQFQQAIALDPSYTRARNSLGMVFKQAGNLNGALEQFRQVVAIETNNDTSLGNL